MNKTREEMIRQHYFFIINTRKLLKELSVFRAASNDTKSLEAIAHLKKVAATRLAVATRTYNELQKELK